MKQVTIMGTVLFLSALMLSFAAACAGGQSNVVGKFEFDGVSMEPTFSDGDAVTVVELGESEPQRGHIILFKPPGQQRDFIKRVIGEPGEVIQISDGTVYIDEQPLIEPYIKARSSSNFGPAVVPADCYFVIGDNRNNSSDSRGWGAVPRYNIIGLVLMEAPQTQVNEVVVGADRTNAPLMECSP